MKTITATEQQKELGAYGSKCDMLSLDDNGNVVVEHVSIKEEEKDKWITVPTPSYGLITLLSRILPDD